MICKFKRGIRSHLTTWIICLTLFLGEVHTFSCFSDDAPENWILTAYKPMPQKWNVQYLFSQIKVPLYFLSFIVWRPTKINRTTIRAMLYAGIIDTIMYFYDFKNPMFFGSFYVWVISIWFLVYYWNTDKGKSIRHAFPKRNRRQDE